MSAAVSVDRLMPQAGRSASEAVREGFRRELQEAAMLSYLPPRTSGMMCADTIPVVGSFGTWYVCKPEDFVAPSPKPKMDAFMTANM
eukprot:CAMPEP_0171091994 /NCGR_PEP_ID=MMETSP0766_2-20121228/35440_1 /TAXON_ID=439317 /ORGANISM="Gambierdiscus australes, Strain CAWD 149" /LENGTH=86 /DNA_ID=CAMNT_0011550185 /DNA_START=70 /DNA_END=330 /DNA_ORIENTATION=+